MSEATDETFDRLAEATRRAVRHTIAEHLIAHRDEDQAAITLGGFAGAVDSFVCAVSEGTPREQIKAALAAVLGDYVDQAKDQLLRASSDA